MSAAEAARPRLAVILVFLFVVAGQVALATSAIDASSVADTRQSVVADGTYTVLVDQEGTWTGAVTAQLIDIPPDASAQLIAGGPAVTLSNTVPGQNIAFTFSGATNQRVSLTLSASPAAHYQLSIKRPDGLTFYGNYENLSFTDALALPADGTYTVLVDQEGTWTGAVTAQLTCTGCPTLGTRPTVTAIAPTSGPAAGGTTVAISGTEFATVPGATTVLFGANAATNASCVTTTSCSATSPAGSSTVDVTVTVAGLTSAVSAADRFAYALSPTVTSVSPNGGSTAGGTSVAITGTDFVAPATVSFGAVAAAIVTVVSTTQIAATTPFHGAETVDVTVTVAGQTSATGPAGRFTFEAPVPTVTQVMPSSGSIAGGTAVTLTGTDFVVGATVSFDGSAASNVVFVSATSITAKTPPHVAGVVGVTVTNTDGQASTCAGCFAFRAAPTVSAVTPTSGTTAGGTAATIAGTNFAAGATVSFGGAPATNVVVVSPMSISAMTPAHAAGTVEVTVTVAGQTSATSIAGQFTFVSPSGGSGGEGTGDRGDGDSVVSPPSSGALLPKPAPLRPAAGALPAAVGYHAQWLTQSISPVARPGELAEWAVAFRNTGELPWLRGTLGQNVALGSSGLLDNKDADRLGLNPGNWQYANRLAQQNLDFVAPGQIAWFRVQLRAPMAHGTYRVSVRPVVDGVGWLDDYGVFFVLTVDGQGVPTPTPERASVMLLPRPGRLQPTAGQVPSAGAFGAQWVAQTAVAIARPGALTEWAVAFKNTGSTAWTRGALGGNVALGSSAPLNNIEAERSGLDPGNWQHATRLAQQSAAIVAPGETAWFLVQLRAPSTPGTYRVDVRPVADGVTWLDDYGVYFLLVVQ